MLEIIGEGTKTTVVHRDSLLPQSELVPSKREALEALGAVQAMVQRKMDSVLIDNEQVTLADAFEVLRRFVLTR
jgi:hypothetical protein